MKHEKLLFTLVILALIISTAAYINSLLAIKKNVQQEELLQAISSFDVSQAAKEEFVFDGDHGLLLEPQAQEAVEEQSAPAEQADSSADKPATPNVPKTEVKKPETAQAVVTDDGYVDLDLPSGALWKAQNEEGLVTYDEAKKNYGRSLPALKHWEELTKYCTWEWTGKGYIVTGPNGNSIFFPADGYRNFSGQTGKAGTFGNYWSSTSKNKEEAWRLGFEPGKISLATNSRKYGRSVRLIKRGSILKEVRE